MEALDAIGGRDLRATLLYVRGSRAPVSAAEAAAGLGIHPSVARSRLERLLRAGLLEASFSRRSGRSGPGAGRPAKLYTAAPELETLEFPSRRLPLLVARLLDEVPEEGREVALRRAGEEFGYDVARTAGLRARARPVDGFEGICAAVRSLGFQATLDRLEGDTAVISTPTCPLRPVVVVRPEAAHIDRGMWVGLVARGLRDVRADDVDCQTHSCLDGGGPCSVVIRLRACQPRL